MADFDFLLRDKSAARRQYGASAHASAANLPAEFFRQPALFGKRGSAVVKEIQRVRQAIKQQAEQQFYQAKRVADTGVAGLAGFVAAIRKSGLGLLDGELEDLSTEGAFLSPTNKLSLDKIYQIRSRLTSGTKLSSFMELGQLNEFLTAVFAKPTNPDGNCAIVTQAAGGVGQGGSTPP